MTKTYSEEEARALVADAVTSATAGLTQRVGELEGAAASSEVESRIAAAKAEGDAKAVELQAALDAKEIELQAEKARADQIEAERAAAQAQAEVEARRETRVAKAKEVAGFSDEYLGVHGDKYAAMSDEEFELACAGWTEARATALAAANVDPSKVPATTALTATREPDAGRPMTGRALVSQVANLRLQGIDTRRI